MSRGTKTKSRKILEGIPNTSLGNLSPILVKEKKNLFFFVVGGGVVFVLKNIIIQTDLESRKKL